MHTHKSHGALPLRIYNMFQGWMYGVSFFFLGGGGVGGGVGVGVRGY